MPSQNNINSCSDSVVIQRYNKDSRRELENMPKYGWELGRTPGGSRQVKGPNDNPLTVAFYKRIICYSFEEESYGNKVITSLENKNAFKKLTFEPITIKKLRNFKSVIDKAENEVKDQERNAGTINQYFECDIDEKYLFLSSRVELKKEFLNFINENKSYANGKKTLNKDRLDSLFKKFISPKEQKTKDAILAVRLASKLFPTLFKACNEDLKEFHAFLEDQNSINPLKLLKFDLDKDIDSLKLSEAGKREQVGKLLDFLSNNNTNPGMPKRVYPVGMIKHYEQINGSKCKMAAFNNEFYRQIELINKRINSILYASERKKAKKLQDEIELLKKNKNKSKILLRKSKESEKNYLNDVRAYRMFKKFEDKIKKTYANKKEGAENKDQKQLLFYYYDFKYNENKKERRGILAVSINVCEKKSGDTIEEVKLDFHIKFNPNKIMKKRTIGVKKDNTEYLIYKPLKYSPKHQNVVVEIYTKLTESRIDIDKYEKQINHFDGRINERKKQLQGITVTGDNLDQYKNKFNALIIESNRIIDA